MKKSINEHRPPFTLQHINRVLVVLIVILALLSGYFHALYSNEHRKYSRLLQRYQTLQNAQVETTQMQPERK